MRSISRIVQELSPRYIAVRKQEVVDMMELLAASDFERLGILSHSLKGSGGTFGFPELTQFGASLEHHAKQADAVSFARELGRLKEYLQRFDVPADAVDRS